jgi:hypothetical protein
VTSAAPPPWWARLSHAIGLDEVRPEEFRPKLLGGIVTG